MAGATSARSPRTCARDDARSPTVIGLNGSVHRRTLSRLPPPTSRGSSMRLIRDLWATSPRRFAAVALLIVLGAAGQTAGAALAGPVLVDRSTVLFGLLAVALVTAVFTDLRIGLIVARLTADWSADARRRLCRVAFGQDLPRLEATPVGELLDRIDGDVAQGAAELRGRGVRITQDLTLGVLSIATATVVWWPAGVGMVVLAALLAVGLSRPARRITPLRIAEEEAW